jgi:hypothetical protein
MPGGASPRVAQGSFRKGRTPGAHAVRRLFAGAGR